MAAKLTRPAQPKKAGSQKQADWLQFEQLIASIQTQLAGKATVRHNEKVRGRSGVDRQLDVTIRSKVGLYPVLVAIECRHFRRRIDIKHVDAFANVLEDVEASKGVMISRRGFTEGARAMAFKKNVTLQTLEQATSAHWTSLVTSSTLILSSTINATLSAFDPDDLPVQLSSSSSLVTDEQVIVATGEDVIREAIAVSRSSMPVGSFKVDVEIAPPLMLKGSEPQRKVARGVLTGENVATEYILSPSFDSGHLLVNSAGKTEYAELTSEGFDWEAVVRSQEGRKLTADEYSTRRSSGSPLAVSLGMNLPKKFLRFVLRSRPSNMT